jgi:hypothetical protein
VHVVLFAGGGAKDLAGAHFLAFRPRSPNLVQLGLHLRDSTEL